MTTATPYSDEEIVAFLDGEMDPARADALDRAAARDGALQARILALSIDVASLGAAFGQLSAGAPPAPDLPAARAAPPARRTRLWPSLIAASLAGAILAGGAFSLLSPPQGDRDWKRYVAAYQALYVEPTLAHLDPDPADQTVELARLTRAIGRDLPLGALAGTTPLDYKRGQILGYDGKTLIQLAFQSGDGAPYALCLIKQDRDEPLTTGEMEGLKMASWAKDGYAWMLIGGTDEATVAEAAKTFRALL